MFKIMQGKGFHVTFENGISCSVQFGLGNYCDHYRMSGFENFTELNREIGEKGSKTAEIAAWQPNDDWVRMPHWEGDVQGYQTPKQVLEFLTYMASL